MALYLTKASDRNEKGPRETGAFGNSSIGRPQKAVPLSPNRGMVPALIMMCLLFLFLDM